MGTPLQEVYDAFLFKNPETDFTDKQDLIFQLFKASLGYCYKTVPESLDYTLTIPEIFDGEFTDTLGQDSIELIALTMCREFYRRTMDKLTKIKQYVGTQAFNKLPNEVELLKQSMAYFKSLSDEINDFKQTFYPYDNK